MLGNVVREWHSSGAVVGELPEGSLPVATDMLHHDVIELSSGNFLGLGLEVRSVVDFPAEYPPGTKRAPADVAGDVLIEFARDGSTVRQWSVLDILDPERLGEGSLDRTFYEDIYQDRYDPMPYDITHSNALYYLEEEDAVLVSSYRQCLIYKVNMATGELATSCTGHSAFAACTRSSTDRPGEGGQRRPDIPVRRVVDIGVFPLLK